MPEDKRRILIVDDDKLALAMLRDIFADSYEVLEAPGGEAALEILKNQEVTAILSDHIMPGLTGVEVLQRSIEIWPKAVRVLVTASEDVKDIRDAVNIARVHRVISKPIHAVAVEGILHGAIRERDLEQENERLVGELKQALAELQQRELELERELMVRTLELREVLDRAVKQDG